MPPARGGAPVIDGEGAPIDGGGGAPIGPVEVGGPARICGGPAPIGPTAVGGPALPRPMRCICATGGGAPCGGPAGVAGGGIAPGGGPPRACICAPGGGPAAMGGAPWKPPAAGGPPAGAPFIGRCAGGAPGVRREAPRDDGAAPGEARTRRARPAGDRLAARSRGGGAGIGSRTSAIARRRGGRGGGGGDASGVGRGDRGALETNEIVVCRCRGPTSRFARRCSVRARPFASRRGRTLRHHRRPRRGAGRAGGLPVRPGRGLHRGDTRRARASDDAKGESRCFTGAGFHSAAASAGRSGRTKSVRPEFCQTASRWSHFVWKKGVGRLWPRSPTASSCWTRACASSC